MDITCPKCGYSRWMDADRVPDRVVRVTCPSCSEVFQLDGRAVREELSSPGRENQNRPVSDGRPEAEPAPAYHPAAREPADVVADQPKAGFWIRVVAYFIDGAVVGLAQFLLGLAFGLVTGLFEPTAAETRTAFSVLSGLLGITISLAYGVFFIGYCGQTPGKMLVRVKVIRTDGTAIRYGRAFLREVPGKFLSGILLCIGYLMVAFDSQKQGLHDKIADTYVIKV